LISPPVLCALNLERPKNRDAGVFPFTPELQAVLGEQKAKADECSPSCPYPIHALLLAGD